MVQRAMAVMAAVVVPVGLLAAAGTHRGVAPPDLLVAACAERLGLTVIHCDADFDAIAEVTGQPTRWALTR